MCLIFLTTGAQINVDWLTYSQLLEPAEVVTLQPASIWYNATGASQAGSCQLRLGSNTMVRWRESSTF